MSDKKKKQSKSGPSGSIGTTPIYDTLNAQEKAMLTVPASELTEEQVLLHNWSMAGFGESPIPEIRWEDVRSLEKAFIARDKRLYGLRNQSGPLSVEPEGSDCCCCCPASCCSAAADVKPVRSRRLFV